MVVRVGREEVWLVWEKRKFWGFKEFVVVVLLFLVWEVVVVLGIRVVEGGGFGM